jgi:predicted DNA-binding mobile mystery protein A
LKVNRKKQITQKRVIQQKLDHFSKLNESIPAAGWLKAVRGSLGLTIRQLAERVGVGHGSIYQLEKREPQKKVTLESLEGAARAMDCKVIYAIVPLTRGAKLDDIIFHNATVAATKIVSAVDHTMKLEAQGASVKYVKSEIRRIANDLIESNDIRIWQVEKKTKLKKK